MTYDHVQVSRDGDHATITMDRPQRRNALSLAHMHELQSAFREVGDSDALGIVLAGNGPVFSAGHDFADVAGADLDTVRELLWACTELMDLIQSVPQPVVARVHGLATAAGCQLVATCDMAIAAEGAEFGVNGVDIGLFCSTPMVALTRNVGAKKAFEMLATGRFLSAAEAVTAGLVNRAVPAEALDGCVAEHARIVAGKLPGAVRIGKGVFHAQGERPVEEAYALARDAMVANLADPDAAEGIQAFLEKRAPRWT